MTDVVETVKTVADPGTLVLIRDNLLLFHIIAGVFILSLICTLFFKVFKPLLLKIYEQRNEKTIGIQKERIDSLELELQKLKTENSSLEQKLKQLQVFEVYHSSTKKKDEVDDPGLNSFIAKD